MNTMLLFAPLLAMAYEDFRYRAIHWYWLVALTIGVLWRFPPSFAATTSNAFITLFQLGVLTLYFSLKNRKLVYLPSQWLGWGDILFFIPLCLLFSPGNFIIFLVCGLGITMLSCMVCRLLLKGSDETAPLAGYLSLCLVAIILMAVYGGFNPKNDAWLTSLLKQYYT